MTIFYEKAMEDQELGVFFINELGDDITNEDWTEHIELLADFWLAEILNQDTYYGNFIGAHVKLPRIEKEIFSNWIKLFSISADATYIPSVAKIFKDKGVLLSKKFIRDLNL